MYDNDFSNNFCIFKTVRVFEIGQTITVILKTIMFSTVTFDKTHLKYNVNVKFGEGEKIVRTIGCINIFSGVILISYISIIAILDFFKIFSLNDTIACREFSACNCIVTKLVDNVAYKMLNEYRLFFCIFEIIVIVFY